MRKIFSLVMLAFLILVNFGMVKGQSLTETVQPTKSCPAGGKVPWNRPGGTGTPAGDIDQGYQVGCSECMDTGFVSPTPDVSYGVEWGPLDSQRAGLVAILIAGPGPNFTYTLDNGVTTLTMSGDVGGLATITLRVMPFGVVIMPVPGVRVDSFDGVRFLSGQGVIEGGYYGVVAATAVPEATTTVTPNVTSTPGVNYSNHFYTIGMADWSWSGTQAVADRVSVGGCGAGDVVAAWRGHWNAIGGNNNFILLSFRSSGSGGNYNHWMSWGPTGEGNNSIKTITNGNNDYVNAFINGYGLIGTLEDNYGVYGIINLGAGAWSSNVSEWRTVQVSGQSIVCYGRHEVVPTPTVAPTTTALPPTFCQVPTYVDSVPAVSWDGLILDASTPCLKLIPNYEFSIGGTTYALPSLGVCFNVYTVSPMTVLGFTVPLTIIAVVPAMWLVVRILQL